ncbi:MAG: S-layer homology domain-containing protein [Acidimicrobiia bacterium]|nr:S-layer homology domain-containing protein [Acidimicrobiia bacterium]
MMRRSAALIGAFVAVLLLALLTGPTGAGATDSQAVTVEAPTVPQARTAPQERGGPFTDVGASHPFAAAIAWMSDEGISTGFGDGTFQPAAAVSRQAMAAFMFRLDGQPAGNWLAAADDFPDVGTSHPFAESIGWMSTEGISTGFGDGTFRPGAPVTRQAMAAFMFRLDGQPAGNWLAGANDFSDVGGGHAFAESIGWMALEGISTGFDDGTFRPTDPVSRQAMAAFMRRFDDTDKQVSAGTGHTCGVAFDAAWCWGNNAGDHLGDGGVATNARVPQRTVGLDSGVTAVTSSISHSCAVADGDVYCWGGNNNNGQLGHDNDELVAVPTLVGGLSGTATEVAVGLQHTCAIVDGAAWCWGRAGRLGIGENTQSTTPLQVVGLTSGVTDISAGEDHTCALVSGGVQCWGSNGNGQLGDDSTTLRQSPVAADGLATGVTTVAVGRNHSCAVQSGAALCWGSNSDGQLGDDSDVNQRDVPTAVVGLSSGVTDINGGTRHTCAVVNGGAQCWGEGRFGAIGDGTDTDRPTPTAVTGLSSGVVSVTAGARQSCASTGRVAWCWGSGALGSGDTSATPSSDVPVRVLWG